MGKKRYALLSFDGMDNTLIQRIAEHTGLPMVHVVRCAVRFYASHGPWPIGANGIREEIIASATSAASSNGDSKPKRKAK